MPATSVSNNYTTSSGRIVKNPNNYPIAGSNALQSQKRSRIGAVTRSLISSVSSPSAHSSVSIVETQSPTSICSSSQNIDNVTTVKVTGPTIMPIKQEPEHFIKVSIQKKFLLIF